MKGTQEHEPAKTNPSVLAIVATLHSMKPMLAMDAGAYSEERIDGIESHSTAVARCKRIKEASVDEVIGSPQFQSAVRGLVKAMLSEIKRSPRTMGDAVGTGY